jgi:hypothetical protein
MSSGFTSPGPRLTAPAARIEYRAVRSELSDCVQERASAVEELRRCRATYVARWATSAMSALMVVAEVVDTVCLMRGFAQPDGLGPWELLALLGLMLAHTKVGPPCWPSHELSRLRELNSRVAELTSRQWELEILAEVGKMRY